MNIDINNIVRSVAIASVGVPLPLSLSNVFNTTATVAGRVDEPTKQEVILTEYTDKLTKACIGFAFSKPDSKLERDAKNTIDEVLGGEIDNYSAVCNGLVW